MIQLAKIHEILAKERREQGLSQIEIARALNVEQATVSYYENGKRGIPLELMDAWLRILGIEIKLQTRGNTPAKSQEETMNDLEVFRFLKCRRNYLIPEMRTMLAQKLLQEPLFRKTDTESGDGLFWAYSPGEEPEVGILETRHDHPEQKYLVVEYTEKEVNLYQHLRESRGGERLPEAKWLENSRTYFSEDDYLTLSGQWDSESLAQRKVTVFRESKTVEDGVQLLNAAGFSLRALSEIQQVFLTFRAITEKVKACDVYSRMEIELREIQRHLTELMLDNRYENGKMNPDFVLWDETDRAVIDVPLWSEKRNWQWIREGEEWFEESMGPIKGPDVQTGKDSAVHDGVYTHKDRVFYVSEHEADMPAASPNRINNVSLGLEKAPNPQNEKQSEEASAAPLTDKGDHGHFRR